LWGQNFHSLVIVALQKFSEVSKSSHTNRFRPNRIDISVWHNATAYAVYFRDFGLTIHETRKFLFVAGDTGAADFCPFKLLGASSGPFSAGAQLSSFSPCYLSANQILNCDPALSGYPFSEIGQSKSPRLRGWPFPNGDIC
jgi:hypothetical protein